MPRTNKQDPGLLIEFNVSRGERRLAEVTIKRFDLHTKPGRKRFIDGLRQVADSLESMSMNIGNSKPVTAKSKPKTSKPKTAPTPAS